MDADPKAIAARKQLVKTFETMQVALIEIVNMAPEEEPDVEDYDDTESASSRGIEVGHWEAAEIARKALKEIGAYFPNLKPLKLTRG